MGLGAINQHPVNTIPVNGWLYPGGAVPIAPPYFVGEVICVPGEAQVFQVFAEQFTIPLYCEQNSFKIPPEEAVIKIPAGNKTCS